MDKDKREFCKHIIVMSLLSIGMDRPSNLEEIVDFVYTDVSETADKDNYHSGDVVIGLRRWIESKTL